MTDTQTAPLVAIDASLCAHTRKGQIGCTRCQDACPSSALKTGRNAIELDAEACDGHGACTTVCPTGAIRFIPQDEPVLQRLRTLLLETSESAPVVIIHDKSGKAVFDYLAEEGTPLPPHALPLEAQAPTEAGLDLMLSAAAYGAASVRILTGPEHRDTLPALESAAETANTILAGLGLGLDRVTIDDGQDPDALAQAWSTAPAPVTGDKANFAPMGTKRQIMSLALDHLAGQGTLPDAPIPLAPGAPFGSYAVDGDKCTLCYSCITACPGQALNGTPDRLLIAFEEANCVQCGLCKTFCPEDAVTLTPQLSLAESTKSPQVLYRDEPFTCVKCGHPFASKSAIDHMTAKLAQHPMFKDSPEKMDMIKSCEQCRSAF